jgi:hypothetical protein
MELKLKQCRSCGKPINVYADPCPLCKTPTPFGKHSYPDRQTALLAKPAEFNVERFNAQFNRIAALVILLVFVAGFAYCSTRPPRPAHDTFDARVMCEQFIRERLKAPRTARFLGHENAHDLGGGRYEVIGHVDAQNSFGAMLRSSYVCQVQWIGGERWRLESLTGL